MKRFFVFLYVTSAVAQLPVSAAVVHTVGGATGWGIGAALLAAFMLLLRGRVALARWDRPITAVRRHLIEEPFFVHWCASLLALSLSLGLVPLWWLIGRAAGEACLLSYVAALPFAIWGVCIRRRWVRVREFEVVLATLPVAFDGYRIAQLSDIHLGSHCPRERVDKWVNRVNARDVDLVALTGDYVTSGVRFHRDIASALGRLEARDGVFAVMGNHDYYGEGEPLMTLLQDEGIRLLRNERVSLRRTDSTMVLAGVDDVFTRRIDIAKTTAGLSGDDTVVMLAHDPCSFPELAQSGCSLVLSGHTHWGQVALPWFAASLNYAQFTTEYAAGRYVRNGCVLYVHPGLGTTGPPVRLGTWPELTIITLRCGVPDSCEHRRAAPVLHARC